MPLPIMTAWFCAMIGAAQIFAATGESIKEALQKGLYEEEANHDLNAAMQAYQSVINQAYDQRKFAATAVFRLGECNRKLGKTNEAAQLYTRLLSDFAEQTNLVQSCRVLLAGMGGPAPAAPVAGDFASHLSINAEAGDLSRLKTLLKDSPDLIHAKDSGGKTPFHHAAENGFFLVMQFLLDQGVDINAKASYDKTALHWAVEKGQKSTVDFLLSKGADPNAADNLKNTPLFLAANKGYRSLAESLLKAKANPNAMCLSVSGDRLLTPLHTATYNYRSIVELLLDYGADVQAQAECVDYDNPARKKFMSQMSAVPLGIAASGGNTNIAGLLLKNGAKLDEGGLQGLPPLMVAIAFKQNGFVQWLLEQGANPNIRITNGLTVTDDTPSGRGKSTAATFSLAEGCTPLHLAVNLNDAACALLLLQHRTDVNAKTAKNETPLAAAMYVPVNIEMIDCLMKAGADVDVQDKDGATALHRAVRVSKMGGGNAEQKVKLLVNAKANTELRTKEGNTPLMEAVSNGYRESLEILADGGANVNATNKLGQTLLMMAVQRNDLAAAQVLLSHKAEVNMLDSQGKSVLDWVPKPGGIPGMIPPPSFPGTSAEINRPGRAVSPTADNELGKMLREAGASEDYRRRNRIQAYRPSMGAGDKTNNRQDVFFKQTAEEASHYTMLEFIATVFANTRPVADFSFPELDHLRINRLTAKPGGYKVLEYNLSYLLEPGSTNKDIPLEWGDIVEIPELDHLVQDKWNGLDAKVWHMLDRSLQKSVTITVKGQPTVIQLLPPSPYLNVPPEPAAKQPSKIVLRTRSLKNAVFSSGLLRTTSDISRIRFKRPAKEGRPAQEFTCSLSRNAAADMENFVLCDGDEVEIPEKE